MSISNRTMTVGELKQALANFDDNMPVVLQGDYGDRINTPQALWVTDPEEAKIMKTAYSETGWKVCIDDDDREEGEIEVVVLSYDESC